MASKTAEQEQLTRATGLISQARRHFSRLRDPRRRRGKRHLLVDVVLISLLAMLCGCDDADDIAQWAELHADWLREWFELEHGTPSQDTVLRVFEALNPDAFARAVIEWLDGLRGDLVGHIAIDGKTLRGSQDRCSGRSPIHVVSAWLREANLVLGQVKTEDKSNEITAIPVLLDLIDVKGSVVSIDAGGCHRAIAEKIVNLGGHYMLAVKGNQPTLREDIERLFVESRDARCRSEDELERPESTQVRDTDSGHGRIEERVATLCQDVSWLTTAEQWAGLSGVAMVEATRTNEITGEVETEQRYYITSDPSMTAEGVLRVTRGHWSVENNLHWVLDVMLGEDRSRIRARRAAENFGMLRRLVLSMLKAAPTPKKRMSMKHRRRYCDHRRDYLMQVLTASHS